MSDTRVSLVIPGRNCARTIRACLDAAIAIQRADRSPLGEIIFVDDGSTDETPRILAEYPVTVLHGHGGGPGAARNIGWRASSGRFAWFIDSDCVAEPEALARLLVRIERSGTGERTGDDGRPDSSQVVGGVGGSYGNQCPSSLLACLIHEEIIARHRRMPREVNFLGGFNVLYRRDVLERVGGFDESRFNGPGSPGAEDAELSYRVHAAGFRLLFEPESRVGHYHPTRLRRYLRVQRHHGYWRVALHMAHIGTAAGDAYSGVVDHAQPVLALLIIACTPFAIGPTGQWALLALGLILLGLQIPMTLSLLRRTRRVRYLAFVPLGVVRAFWRGIGMLQGLIGHAFHNAPDRSANKAG